MKEKHITFTYEPGDPGEGYIYLKKSSSGQVANTITLESDELKGELVLDLDAEGKIIGIEVLGNIIPDELKGSDEK